MGETVWRNGYRQDRTDLRRWRLSARTYPFAVCSGRALHLRDCHVVQYCYDAALQCGSTAVPRVLTRAEAQQWFVEERGRRRCRFCSPDVPEYQHPPAVRRVGIKRNTSTGTGWPS